MQSPGNRNIKRGAGFRGNELSPSHPTAVHRLPLHRAVRPAGRRLARSAARAVGEAEAQAENAGAPLLPAVQASAQAGRERQLNLHGQERNHVLYPETLERMSPVLLD